MIGARRWLYAFLLPCLVMAALQVDAWLLHFEAAQVRRAIARQEAGERTARARRAEDEKQWETIQAAEALALPGAASVAALRAVALAARRSGATLEQTQFRPCQGARLSACSLSLQAAGSLAAVLALAAALEEQAPPLWITGLEVRLRADGAANLHVELLYYSR